MVALATTAALAATPASAVTVNCGLKSYSLVFWPKGNTANRLAHVNFYKLTSTFPQSALLGSIDREGGGTFVPRCKHLTRTPSFHTVTRQARTTRATTLRCRFPRNATISVHPISNEDEELGIHMLVGRRTVLFAQLYSDHPPVLRYDRGYCRRSHLP